MREVAHDGAERKIGVRVDGRGDEIVLRVDAVDDAMFHEELSEEISNGLAAAELLFLQCLVHQPRLQLSTACGKWEQGE